jgi:hypothetical protein
VGVLVGTAAPETMWAADREWACHNITDWLTGVSIKFTEFYFNLVVSINNNYEGHALQQDILYTARPLLVRPVKLKKLATQNLSTTIY